MTIAVQAPPEIFQSGLLWYMHIVPGQIIRRTISFKHTEVQYLRTFSLLAHYLRFYKKHTLTNIFLQKFSQKCYLGPTYSWKMKTGYSIDMYNKTLHLICEFYAVLYGLFATFRWSFVGTAWIFREVLFHFLLSIHDRESIVFRPNF